MKATLQAQKSNTSVPGVLQTGVCSFSHQFSNNHHQKEKNLTSHKCGGEISEHTWPREYWSRKERAMYWTHWWIWTHKRSCYILLSFSLLTSCLTQSYINMLIYTSHLLVLKYFSLSLEPVFICPSSCVLGLEVIESAEEHIVSEHINAAHCIESIIGN